MKVFKHRVHNIVMKEILTKGMTVMFEEEHGDYKMPAYLMVGSKDWEEVTPKPEYTILSFKRGCTLGELGEIKKVKQKLFTTEDDVDIYENDEYWILTSFLQQPYKAKAVESFKNPSRRPGRDFSTKEAAEEYVLMNKPLLTVKEVIKLRDNGGMMLYTEEIIKLAQSKLK